MGDGARRFQLLAGSEAAGSGGSGGIEKDLLTLLKKLSQSFRIMDSREDVWSDMTRGAILDSTLVGCAKIRPKE